MILLLGGNGYVGSAYRKYFDANRIAYQSFSRAELPYTQPGVLEKHLKTSRPDFLINCAGYTGKPNVDACEADKANCLFGNAVLPGIIAEACASADLPWGHVSSGCIYTGCKPDGSGFTEEDPPNFSFRTNNCSFYSGTKALGEEVLKDAPGLYQWRMRIPFNHEDGPRNYLSKLMRYARLLEAENSITQLDEFVTGTLACFEKQVPYGLYNFTNPGHITTRQVAGMIEAAGLAPHPFSFFTDEAEFMQKAAVTPRSNCVLDSSKLRNAGIHLTPVVDAIRDALDRWIPEFPVT
ncbi:MAG: sugar nucleotide-binding protein [Verrucomicrobia bacterium]|nr:sugar nucleotide-binding protein [Verrucomicrobiota bacterium]MCH8528176.1 sugar nucleotide-binding protein [Kiritimatiellia bacterium]